MEPDRQQRLNEIATIAVSIETETHLPAQVLIAQWALESEWGAKPAGHANYFGIKKAARHAKCCTVTTHETINGKDVIQDLEFADYDSLLDSARDYAWLLTHGEPYAEAWRAFQGNGAVRPFVFAIALKYATGLGYARLAVQIADQQNVADAIQKARMVTA